MKYPRILTDSRGLAEIPGYYLTYTGYIIFIISTFFLIGGLFFLDTPKAVAPTAFVGSDDVLLYTLLESPYGDARFGEALILRYEEQGSDLQGYADIQAHIEALMQDTYGTAWWELKLHNLDGDLTLLKLQAEASPRFSEQLHSTSYVYLPGTKKHPVINVSLKVIP